MSAKPISRFSVPDLVDAPEDIRERIVQVQEKSGFVPNVFFVLARRPDEFRAFFAYHDALMEKPRRPQQGRARDDRGGDLGGQPVPLLRRRPRRHPAHSRQEPAGRRSDCDQLSQGGHLGQTQGDARFRACRRDPFARGRRRRHQGAKEHGFTPEDVWDIAAIAAFFAMSNRLANVASIRPNDEFYAMGRG